jgi:hypothetical protein
MLLGKGQSCLIWKSRDRSILSRKMWKDCHSTDQDWAKDKFTNDREQRRLRSRGRKESTFAEALFQ